MCELMSFEGERSYLKKGRFHHLPTCVHHSLWGGQESLFLAHILRGSTIDS